MNNIQLKTVNELSSYAFFVSAYQRGYRWAKLEVLDLLNDIDEFEPHEIKGSNDKTWYCPQPIVIKKKSENKYEIIDGQQRLTTTYLILCYLKTFIIVSRGDVTKEGNCDKKYIAIAEDDSYCYLLKGKRPANSDNCIRIT